MRLLKLSTGLDGVAQTLVVFHESLFKSSRCSNAEKSAHFVQKLNLLHILLGLPPQLCLCFIRRTFCELKLET